MNQVVVMWSVLGWLLIWSTPTSEVLTVLS